MFNAFADIATDRTKFTSLRSVELHDLFGGGLTVVKSFDKDERIFTEEDDARCLYKVASGAVRLCNYLEDGRRQVGAFCTAGDLFGIEGMTNHAYSAEAITRTELLAFPRGELGGNFGGDASFAREIASCALSNLERARRHTALLARKLAPEKVAMFLLDMSDRAKSDCFELPMSRTDIADYLGLTIETVSRTLTQFARDSTIVLLPARRDVMLRNKALLRRLDRGCPA
jgi:CRP/FNR family transcriptional regulator, nitrogen fixation regulation protein